MPNDRHTRFPGRASDVRVQSDAAVATVWLALYLLILAATLARPAVSGALELAALF